MLLAAQFSRTAADRRVAGILWIALFLVMAFRPAARAGADKSPYDTLIAAGLGGDLEHGYSLRADSWTGELPIDGSKKIEHTLLRGNEYRFFAYSTTKGARISFHVQDHDGTAVEARCWQKDADDFCFAGADVTPKQTGGYVLVLKIEQSPVERTEWLLVYAYR